MTDTGATSAPDLNNGYPATWSAMVAPGGMVCARPDPERALTAERDEARSALERMRAERDDAVSANEQLFADNRELAAALKDANAERDMATQVTRVLTAENSRFHAALEAIAAYSRAGTAGVLVDKAREALPEATP
jgi:hypothetical protein